MSDGRALAVWLGDRLAGDLILKENGNLQFRYAEGYDSLPLSYSMPKRAEGFPNLTCQAWFGGLLPEGAAATMLARQIGVTTANTFRILGEVGSDCAGAVSIREPGEQPSLAATSPERLDPHELEALLAALPRRPMAYDPARGIRLSLAGAQAKIPVIRELFDTLLPTSPETPTTHIIKPEPADLPGIVENEEFCMSLARMAGLNVPTVEALGKQTSLPYLLVDRYDRKLVDGGVERVHQEDFCQALGILSAAKYQEDGGPSFFDGFELLRDASADPARDTVALWDAAIFNWAIGNCDAHGKNFSILYGAGGARLAPFYDLVSTVAYPELDRRLAMTIGGTTDISEVNAESWRKLARRVGLGERFAMARAESMLSTLQDVSGLTARIGHHQHPPGDAIRARISSLAL